MSNLPAVLVHICLGCEAQSECSSCGFIIESRVQKLEEQSSRYGNMVKQKRRSGLFALV